MAQGAPPGGQAPDALQLANRRRIYDLVRRSPGLHLREVVREVALPYGTAEYHLRVLEQEGLIRGVEDQNFRRYFASDFAFGDRAVIALLRKRPVRAVVLALLEKKELTHQELAKASGLKPSTLSYHLAKMEAAKLVAVSRDGRFARARLADPSLVSRLLVTHARSFADSAVDRFVATWAGFGAPAHREGPDKSALDGGSGPQHQPKEEGAK